MTSSLPESVDDLYRYTPTFNASSDTAVVPLTLWSRLNECNEGCTFFRNMAAKSLIAKDFNDPNASVSTIFVPRTRDIEMRNGSDIQSEMMPHRYVSSLTIPGQLFILPKPSPINIKVQNKLKEYISINIRELNDGGDAFVQALDRLWIVIVPNIMCSNGVIHLVEEVYSWN